MSEQDWRAAGLCGQTDPELFFSDLAADQRKAKSLCATCVSFAPCEVDSLTNGGEFGTQAGRTADERRQIIGHALASPAATWAPLTDEARAAAIERIERIALRRRVETTDRSLNDLAHPNDEPRKR